jgi:hypothetical protein
MIVMMMMVIMGYGLYLDLPCGRICGRREEEE